MWATLAGAHLRTTPVVDGRGRRYYNSLGTLSIILVEATTCGWRVAMVTVVDRPAYGRHRTLVARTGGVMTGKFEAYKDRSGKFRFRLKASNGPGRGDR